MVVPTEAITNIVPTLEDARIFLAQNGWLALSLLPLAHVGFVRLKNIPYLPSSEEVVETRDEVPKDAIITKELLNGQYMDDSLFKNPNKDWVASLHTDDKSTMRIGGWPTIGERIPNSANLTRREADKLAKKLFPGS